MTTEGTTLYERLGGESVLLAFVEKFYDSMEKMPEVAYIRQMHAEDLSHAREALFMFLSGMIGGPPLFMKKYGHPRLRQRHMRFSIGDSERDQWLLCAEKSIHQLDIGDHEKQEFFASLASMSNHLRNQGSATQVTNCTYY